MRSVIPAALPRTVIVCVPTAALAATATFIAASLPVGEAGTNVTLTPAGVVAVSATAPVKPPVRVRFTCAEPLAPCTSDCADGATDIVNAGGGFTTTLSVAVCSVTPVALPRSVTA